MLHDREQFDVRVAEFFHIRNQLIGKFAVGEPAILVVGNGAPGAEVHFVDGDGGFEPFLGSAVRDPIGVLPLVGVEIGDNGPGSWTNFRSEAVRVRFERKHVAVRGR